MAMFGFKKKTEAAPAAEPKAVPKTPEETKQEAPAEKKVQEIPPEETFLLERTIRCVVCDKVFKSKALKSKSATRLEPDLDLRPRFKQLDALKYDVVSCPYCGYSALSQSFDHLTAGQIRLVKENYCSKFQPSIDLSSLKMYEYELAFDRYIAALECAQAKKGKISEIAYTSLKLAWLYRGKAETLDAKKPENQAEIKQLKALEEKYYIQAYDGFLAAVSQENYPICGMDECTLDYLLAVMSFHFKKYDTASQCISKIQTSPFATKRIKDKVFDLKNMILEERKKEKEG